MYSRWFIVWITAWKKSSPTVVATMIIRDHTMVVLLISSAKVKILCWAPRTKEKIRAASSSNWSYSG